MTGGAPDVTAEDQERINTFNRSFQQLKEFEAELDGKKKLKEDCEDASNELMLVDEDKVRYVVGECFFHATPDEAEEHMQARLEKVSEEEKEVQNEIDRVKAEMELLKKALYGKFGSSINLEE